MLWVILVLIVYLVLVYGIEWCCFVELVLWCVVLDGLVGIVGGMVLFSVVVGVLWLLGSYYVIGFNV